MGYASGIDGDVSFAAGYVDSVHYWNLRDSIVVNQRPVFGESTMRRSLGVANWEGEYRCWKNAAIATTLGMTGGYYTAGAHRYSIEVTAADLLTTVFGQNYNTRMMGIEDATGSYDCFISDTTALPSVGDSDTLTLTLAVGQTYSLPVLITEVNPRIGADGGERHISINWEGNGDLTASGGVPTIGSNGAAEFIAVGGRKITGTIYVSKISIEMTAQREQAEFSFGFVGSGDPTNS